MKPDRAESLVNDDVLSKKLDISNFKLSMAPRNLLLESLKGQKAVAICVNIFFMLFS